MKKALLFSLLSLVGGAASAQKALQEVIIDYNTLRKKPKTVEVTLPKGLGAVFYRVTAFNAEKVNTNESLYNAIRLVNPEKLTAEGYDFNQHLLTSNADMDVAVGFFEDKTAAEAYSDGRETAACGRVDSTKSAAGMVTCKAEKMYVAVKPLTKGKIATVKVEVVALADLPEDPINDRYPFVVQNELNGEIAYEVSGDRSTWQSFFLPKQRKAEFKLAASQVYLRVSTLDKVSEEYKIDSGKQYRFFWNKDKNRVDLAEFKP
ncbi:MAG: hypothetical protein MUE30_01745 [Spirosomaceae bacterium]|jgi:hypothetical protein|nr:hypothetical protein [Spirosomataceae bacterium]